MCVKAVTKQIKIACNSQVYSGCDLIMPLQKTRVYIQWFRVRDLPYGHARGTLIFFKTPLISPQTGFAFAVGRMLAMTHLSENSFARHAHALTEEAGEMIHPG